MIKEVRRFEDVQGSAIRFRNFAGKAGKYNAEGCRNFALLLRPDDADDMAREGWNVRWLSPRSDDEEPVPYLPIEVKFGSGRPPKIWQVTKRGKTILDEKTVQNLDWAEIESADIAINPYDWNVGGKSGRKAYLRTMFVNIAEDDFEDKYFDVPDSAQNIVDYEEDEN